MRGLLAFHPAAESDLARTKAVRRGALVIQQKASCFSALALDPPAGASVIDGCAAPGSKTSHLASLMGGDGTIYAFDRSSVRLETLRGLMRQRGAGDCVTPIHSDFLKSDPVRAATRTALPRRPCATNPAPRMRQTHPASHARRPTSRPSHTCCSTRPAHPPVSRPPARSTRPLSSCGSWQRTSWPASGMRPPSRTLRRSCIRPVRCSGTRTRTWSRRPWPRARGFGSRLRCRGGRGAGGARRGAASAACIR